MRTGRSLPTGSLFALGGGVEHSVKSAEGGMFLLTVSVAHVGRRRARAKRLVALPDPHDAVVIERPLVRHEPHSLRSRLRDEPGSLCSESIVGEKYASRVTHPCMALLACRRRQESAFRLT